MTETKKGALCRRIDEERKKRKEPRKEKRKTLEVETKKQKTKTKTNKPKPLPSFACPSNAEMAHFFHDSTSLSLHLKIQCSPHRDFQQELINISFINNQILCLFSILSCCFLGNRRDHVQDGANNKESTNNNQRKNSKFVGLKFSPVDVSESIPKKKKEKENESQTY